jgi:hypothetical protein
MDKLYKAALNLDSSRVAIGYKLDFMPISDGIFTIQIIDYDGFMFIIAIIK